MMLDKSQINEWDGAPEQDPSADPVRRQPPRPESVFDRREAVPTGESVRLTPEQTRARKRRGQWLALALFAFVILVFLLTMTKMGADILVRDL